MSIDLDPFSEVAQLLYGGPWVAERFVAVGDFLAAHPARPVLSSLTDPGQP